MVFVSIEMLRVLDEKLEEGWFSFKDFTKELGDRALQVLLDMYCQGILSLRGSEEFLVTDAGRRLVLAWRTSGKPEANPWVDSRVFSMIESSVLAGGRVEEKWRSILEERGFTGESGELSPEAYEVYDTLSTTEKKLVVSKAMAGALVAIPEGPAENKWYDTKWLETFEAMGLIVRSAPNGKYIALTRSGRLLKRAFNQLNLDAPYTALLNESIYKDILRVLNGERLDGEARQRLGLIGYLSGTGSLTRAASLVVLAWRYASSPSPTLPTALSSHEVRVLKRIVELWEKAKSNPELAPTRKRVVENLESSWDLKHYSVSLVLYQLEALGLIEEIPWEKGRIVLKLTPMGERVLRDCGRGSSVTAVRSLVEADRGGSPDEEWISKAIDESLLGSKGPTDCGRALMKVSREAWRSLLVTGLEALILRRMPERKSVQRSDLARSFPGSEEDVLFSLDKLESKGLVRTCLGGRMVITELGLIMKQALIGAPTGVATPVNPHVVKLLEAIRKLGTEDLARLANETKMDLDTLKTALIIARAVKLIGRGGTLTREGEMVLEVISKLRERAEHERT